MRKLTRNIKTLSNVKGKREQQALMRKSGEIIAEILDDDLQTTDTETSIELNFAVLKFKHTIKKKNKWERFELSPAPAPNTAFSFPYFWNGMYKINKLTTLYIKTSKGYTPEGIGTI